MKVKAVIQDIVWYNVRSSKSLKLFFSDIFGTTILFSIAKTKMMTSLKEISAGVVSDQIKVDEDITSLEIPITLFDDIKAAREDKWRSKQVCVIRRKRKTKDNFLTVVKSMKERMSF